MKLQLNRILRRDAHPKYRQAAAAYLVYAIVYLTFAIVRLSPERQSTMGGIPWWAFYLMGAVFLVMFPVLIWREYKWFTRIICFGPFAKGLRLSYLEFEKPEIDPFNIFFALVAFVAFFFLARAGWMASDETGSTKDLDA